MAEIKINSSLINSDEFKFVKRSLIEASEKDGKADYRVSTLEYINDSCENDEDMFFYDMMEFIRFLDPSDPETAKHVAFTTPNMLIYFNMPNDHIKNARQWDFVHDHECLHQLWETFDVAEQIRKNGLEYNHKLLNIASDCVINHYLKDIRHKECSDGLITPESIKDQFGVTYDYKNDTQYSLYVKLLKVYKEMRELVEKFLKEHPELNDAEGESSSGSSGSSGGSGDSGSSGGSGDSGNGDNSSNGNSSGNKNESANDAAKRAQDAADKAKDKANKSGNPEDAKNAKKAQDEANKSKSAAERANNATNDKDKDLATKEARDAANEAEKLANDGSGESADEAAKRAQSAADKAKNKANKSGNSKDANNAKKAQDAADKAKAAADKANKATKDKDKDAATKEARDAADEAEKMANDGDGGDKDGDSSSESSSKKPGKQKGNNITEDEDLEKIRKQAKGIIEKYRKKIAGDFGEFISKCKSSMTLNPSGLSVETQGRGVSSWASKMKTYVNGFVKKKIFQKKREFEPTYKRMNKRQGVVHAGDTIQKGKRVKKNGLTINAAFYIDRSGSMGGEPIQNVWTSCYAICESLKKQFKRDKVVDEISFKMHAFDQVMHELDFGKRMKADGGTMPFHEILSYISKNTKDYMINIIITDAGFDINESEVKNFIKDIDGMILFITNIDSETMKDLSKLYSTKLFYILADAKFTI